VTKTYMPILNWKRGEQSGLANLLAADKGQTYPMIELIDLPEWEQDADAQGRGPFFAIAQQILKAWGTAHPIAVDMEDVDATPNHPIDALFAEARNVGLQLVPVTSPSRSTAHQAAVVRAAQADGRGAVLRLEQDELFDGTTLGGIQQLIAPLGAQPAQVDIVCDLGFIAGQASPMLSTAIRGALSQLPHSGAWRHIVLAASAFPSDLQSIQGVGRISRTEWHLYRTLQSSPWQLTFGDYAVAHPVYTALPFAGAANIRYTVTDDWLILRGRKVTGPGGFGQYVSQSQQLVNMPEFCGAAFSWGDAQIDAYARGTNGTGNITTWRAIGTNHHIVFVLRQLAQAAQGSPAGGAPGRGAPSARA
jgi:hypothetical protein